MAWPAPDAAGTPHRGHLPGLQNSESQAIWGFDRAISSSTNSNPNPNARYSPRNYLIQRYGSGYGNPTTVAGPNPCAGIANQFGGTMSYQYRPGSGYYCGSKQSVGYATLKNPNTTYSGYLNADYRLNDSAEIYGALLYTFAKHKSYAGPNYTWWGANTCNYFVNANTGTFDLAQQTLVPEDKGGLDASANKLWSRAHSFTGGVRGNLGQSDWAYHAYYARSQYNISSEQRRTLGAKVEAFFESQFLGPKLGTYYGYLLVNKIRNTMPPRDKTWVSWPYYNVFNYNAYGRAFWVELNVHFGGGKS